MGMFDYIVCEYPLPDGWKPSGPMQTKDFDCSMVVHTITADGELILERCERWDEVPKEDRPYPNDDGLLGMTGMVSFVKSARKVPFHGIVNFYDLDANKVWHEYNAKFTDGRLVEIVTIDAEN